MAFDVEAHRLGVERLAVVELDARAQPDHDRAATRGPLVTGGELRHDLEIGGDVEELVAERGEDQAADVGAADRRVEGVGIVVQPDPQHGLGGGHAGAEQHEHGESRQYPGPVHAERLLLILGGFGLVVSDDGAPPERAS